MKDTLRNYEWQVNREEHPEGNARKPGKRIPEYRDMRNRMK
jgi:hypothetical protein